MFPGLKTRLKIGMEVHVELATRSKMWSAAPNPAHRDHFDAPPNTLLDGVVLGLPGTLPVMNRAAVEMAVRVGLALGCGVSPVSRWDRKNYFYPDLPKGYQISQYDRPLCGAGVLEVLLEDQQIKPIRIRRVHLEEDAGRLLHEGPGGSPIDHSIVDLNRAGVPLLEVVTEPDMGSAEEAVAFGRALRDICRHLGVSECIMQRGQVRFEPNVNVIIERDGREFATPIVELKNLNSFRAVSDAIAFEHGRQVKLWEESGEVQADGNKSTRGWDEVRGEKGETFPQREKEEAQDYRYFPDPDLVPVRWGGDRLTSLRSALPELPAARRSRYVNVWGLKENDAEALVEEPGDCAFFEGVVGAGMEPGRAASILRNNLARRGNERGVLVSELRITPVQVAAIDSMQRENRVSSSAADELYGLCCDDPGADPARLAEVRGLIQVSDDAALEKWVGDAIAANPKIAADFRGGKEKALGALVGAVMKLSGGKADPKELSNRIREKLAAPR